MKHFMNLQPKYFNYIKKGTKRIELRLYDEKRAAINIGDDIDFSNGDSEDVVHAEVIGLLRYANFKDLFADFEIESLADKSMSKEELIDVLGKFYPKEKQEEYGVLGIRIKLK